MKLDVPNWDNRIAPGDSNPARLTFGVLDAVKRVETTLALAPKNDVVRLHLQDMQAVVLAYKVARDKLRKVPVAKRVVLNHEFTKLKEYLAKFGAHEPGCASHFAVPSRFGPSEVPAACSCGWAAIKETL